MRNDGDVTFFIIQHRWNSEGNRWAGTGGGAGFLFDSLTYDQKRGRLGDYYRSLIAPQAASSALWQRYGINGFEDQNDALKLLRELRALPECPHDFRLVQRRITQETIKVA